MQDYRHDSSKLPYCRLLVIEAQTCISVHLVLHWQCAHATDAVSNDWLPNRCLTPDISFARMTITAPVDLGITAASSLPPWSAKVQRLCAMCILFGNGLRGWGYLLNLLCLLTGAATGNTALVLLKVPRIATR